MNITGLSGCINGILHTIITYDTYLWGDHINGGFLMRKCIGCFAGTNKGGCNNVVSTVTEDVLKPIAVKNQQFYDSNLPFGRVKLLFQATYQLVANTLQAVVYI